MLWGLAIGMPPIQCRLRDAKTHWGVGCRDPDILNNGPYWFELPRCVVAGQGQPTATLDKGALCGSLHSMNTAGAGLCMLLVAATAARAAPNPSALGIWTGQYDCAQGSTALELDVSLLDPTHIQALFYFHALPANPNVPDGCFLMQGSFDDSRQALSLTPTEWLLRPLGYVSVSLAGSIGPDDVLAGDITGPGCSDFSLGRGATGAQTPAACQSPASLNVS